MKIKRIALWFSIVLTIVVMVLISLPRGMASAMVSQQQPWSLVYSGAAFPGTYSYTVNPGDRRLLVVAVSSSISAAVTQTATVTYGTAAPQSLTLQIGDAASATRAHTYLFYLVDTPSVMDGSPQNLVVTITGGTSQQNYVYAGVYAGVDQSTPIGNSQSRNRTAVSATIGPFTTALTIGIGEQAVEIINLTMTATPARTITTWAAGWSAVLGPNSASNLYSSYIAADSTVGTTTSQHTASGTCYSSLSAMSIRPFVPTPAVSQGWSLVYSGAAFPGTYSYTVNAGSERLLVVAVSSSISAAVTQTATVTYGGQSLTLQIGDAASATQAHTYLFYLKDTPSVMDGSPQNLVVTIAGGTTRYNYVYAAVYTGVDQSTPIGNSQNRNRTAVSATIGPFATALPIGIGEQAVEIINLTMTATPARTITTWAAGWSAVLGPNSASNLYSSYIAADSTVGTTTSQHTASGTCYSSMSAMSIRPFVPTPAVSQGWSLVYSGAAFPGTYSYTVNAGSERLLVVAVSSSISAAVTQTATVTYGGQSLTLQIGDAASATQAHTYLFYLKDTPSVMNGSPQNLVVTIAGGTSQQNYVYAAVFAGVDQSTPIGSSRNRNRTAVSATIGPFTTALSIASGEQAVEIINLTMTATPARTITTWAAGWSAVLGPNSASNLYSSYIATDRTAGTTTSQHTASGTCYSSLSAMSIRPSPILPTPTPTATPITPTFTPTEPPPTFTSTETPLPLTGTTYVRYSSMLLNAPDFGLDAQTISGIARGGVGPYTVTVYVDDPDPATPTAEYHPTMMGDYFEVTAASSGDDYFGCSKQGIWRARFLVRDSKGDTYLTTNITWTVSFPRVRGVP